MHFHMFYTAIICLLISVFAYQHDIKQKGNISRTIASVEKENPDEELQALYAKRDKESAERELERAYDKAWRLSDRYVYSDDFLSDALVTAEEKYRQDLMELDKMDEEKLQLLFASEADRVETYLKDHSDELSKPQERKLNRYAKKLRRMSKDKTSKRELKAMMRKEFRKVKEGLGVVARPIAYPLVALSSLFYSVIGVPVHFVAGVIVGEKEEIKSIREDPDSYMTTVDNVSSGNVYFGYWDIRVLFTVANSVVGWAGIAAYAVDTIGYIACDTESHRNDASFSKIENPNTRRFCQNYAKIKMVMIKGMKQSFNAGAGLHKLVEKSLVLRKKDVISEKVCKRKDGGLKVAKRVLHRHRDEYENMEGLLYMDITFRNHPTSPGCASLQFVVEDEELKAKVPAVIDGVNVIVTAE